MEGLWTYVMSLGKGALFVLLISLFAVMAFFVAVFFYAMWPSETHVTVRPAMLSVLHV